MLAAIFFLFTQAVSARTVLVQVPESPRLEYIASLRANSEYTSPTDVYLNSHPQLSVREKLLHHFAQAQKVFLEKTDDLAIVKFKELLKLLLIDDWDRNDREVFLHAYLRLAQLEGENARDHWLGQSLLLGEDLQVEAQLFPPPLLARRMELKQKIPNRIVVRNPATQEWTQMLINGVPCSTDHCGSWSFYPGPVRVTFLSDRWQPVVALLHLSEVERHSPKVIPWVKGECSQPEWNPEAHRFNNKKAFWGIDCDSPPPLEGLNFRPSPKNENPIHTGLSPTKSKGQPFYKSKWLWATVGAAVAAIVVVSSEQKKESKESSTSYGY